MEPQPGGARSCRRGAPGGACELSPTAETAPMSLAIHSTTGTRYELSVPPDETVEGLRKRLSQRLKVPKERLALLHKDTRLSSGKLQEFGVGDGSKLTLVPTVEAGLMSQASRPEQSVMQALESLTETQVRCAPAPSPPLGATGGVPGHSGELWGCLCSQEACGKGRGRAAPPSCQLGLVTQLPLPPPRPPSTLHLTLRYFSPTVASMGEGAQLSQACLRGDLGPCSHTTPTHPGLRPQPHRLCRGAPPAQTAVSPEQHF